MGIDKFKVLEFIKVRGPIIPTDLTKEFKHDTIIMGAFLSELTSSKQVLVSSVKIGGTPLYYIDSQKAKLQDYADHLNHKDREAYELLKAEQVIHDKEVTPLLRVSLRAIKDFAVPVRVVVNDKEILFWRWYLTPLNIVEEKIRSRFVSKEPPKQEIKPETIKKEEYQPVTEEKKEAPKKTPIKKKQTTLVKEEDKEQTTLTDKTIDDELHALVKNFFDEKGIVVKEVNVIRKNSEIEYLIDVPSNVGSLKFFCKAKKKKKINDGDIATVFVAGQTKKLPVLLVTTGELTKKAEKTLETDYTSVTVKSI